MVRSGKKEKTVKAVSGARPKRNSVEARLATWERTLSELEGKYEYLRRDMRAAVEREEWDACARTAGQLYHLAKMVKDAEHAVNVLRWEIRERRITRRPA